MNPAFEQAGSVPASQPVVDYDALARGKRADGPSDRDGRHQHPGGIDELTAFVTKSGKRPAEEERDVFGRL